MNTSTPGAAGVGAASVGAGRAGADRLGTLTAALLLLPALPVAGLAALPLLSASTLGYLELAVPLVCLLLLAVALPAEGGRSPATRVLVTGLVSLPFLVFGCTLASGGTRGVVLPGPGLVVALAVTLGLCAAPLRLRRAVGATLLGLWAVDAVLAPARSAVLPADLNPLRTPTWSSGTLVSVRARPDLPIRGLKPGAPVRVAAGEVIAGATGPGPWFRIADAGPIPRAAPIVRVAGPGAVSDPQRIPRADATGSTRELFVVVGTPQLEHPLDLGGAAIVLVAADAWEADSQARARAQAIAGFVRGGGLVVGLGRKDPWPPELARALGGAATAPEEPGASPVSVPIGLGGVLQASDRAQALVRIEPWLEAPRPGTVFDGYATPPEPPALWTSSAPAAPERWAPGLLLLGLSLAVVLLEPGARRARSVVAALALPVLAATVGVVALAPTGADLQAEAVVFDLGGSGGRRVEALWLRAGERGYRGRVAFAGGGSLRWVGGHRGGGLESGVLELEAGQSAWLVRQSEAHGPDAGDVEDRAAAWLLPWLVGPVDPARMRLGRTILASAHIEGLAPPRATTLTLAAAP